MTEYPMGTSMTEISDDGVTVKYMVTDGTCSITAIYRHGIFQGFDNGLKCSTGTVYGRTYQTVFPSNGTYYEEMLQWLKDNLGNSDDIMPEQRWYVRESRFWFRDQQDQILFLLRWS